MIKKASRFLFTLFLICFALLSPIAVHADDTGLKPPTGSIGTNVKPESIPQLTVNILFFFAGFLGIAYLMYGGIKWITSRGEKTQVEAARKHLTAAIVGVVITAAAFFIMQIVFTVLGAENPLSKGFQLPTLNNVK